MAMSAAQWQIQSEAMAQGGARRSPFRKLALWVSLGWMGLLVLIAVVGHWISPHDPLLQDLTNKFAGPSVGHPLGTDDLGRDVLSRLIIGTQPILEGMLVIMVFTSAIGILWGLIAGITGGGVDLVLMRIADTFLVLPFPIVAIAIFLTLGQGPGGLFVAVAIAVAFSPGLARFMRSGVLVVKGRDYVAVTKMYGLSGGHRLMRHVFPNAFAPISVQIVLLAGLALGLMVILGFLGISQPPPEPNWGRDVAEAFTFILVNPAAVFAPSLVIVLSILAIYRIGDELSDRFTAG
jgi:ABC-type dipeptide/oligopeptide/nickel transport system permease subunit